MRNILILLTLILVACGPDDKHIRLDGRLLNLNQGEFVVYSTDGALSEIDTIVVKGGRFEYEPICTRPGTIVIMLPNSQELPVFITPGGSYSISGDAHNMKQVEVDGGDDNKIMNSFRKETAKLSKEENPDKEIAKIIKEHPLSPVGRYLIERYYLTGEPDYVTAQKLLKQLVDANKANAANEVLYAKVNEMSKAAKGKKLPQIKFTDLKDKEWSNTELNKGTWIIATFASWDFESTNQIRRIKGIKTDRDANWNILGVSLDADKQQCRFTVNMDNDDYIVVCDGKMLQTNVATKLGMKQTGVVIIVKNGIIEERNLYGEPLYDYLKNMKL